jgi:hypothetical protein
MDARIAGRDLINVVAMHCPCSYRTATTLAQQLGLTDKPVEALLTDRALLDTEVRCGECGGVVQTEWRELAPDELDDVEVPGNE